jgi:carboxymethylenebutenolidase
VLDSAQGKGQPVTIVEYAGAAHGFDDPGRKRQSVAANSTAREDVMRRASALFGN